MKEIELIIDDIERRVKLLSLQKANLEQDKLRLETENADLQRQVQELVTENIKLKEEKNINNLINTIIENPNIADSKHIINDLLRKINRSIAIITRDNQL